MAYRARIQLAVLDHNDHIDQIPKQHLKSQEYQYHRWYRKQTCNWDVVKVMEAKDYKYVSELSNEVLKYWGQSTFTMKKRNTTAPDHQCSIQHTIAHTQPPHTNTIVTNQKSRFT